MYQLPDELWNIIKSFTFDWKKYHQYKLKPILKKEINNKFKEIYKRYTLRPIPNNTNIIIENEFVHWSEGIIPKPNLESSDGNGTPSRITIIDIKSGVYTEVAVKVNDNLQPRQEKLRRKQL